MPTIWTDQQKSSVINGSFFLLIDATFFLLIDDTHQLLIENIASLTWMNQAKS